MLYLLTSSNSFPHQKIEKVRVINLTQGGLKAMEELEKLEEDRRNENVGVMLDKKRSGRRKERRSAMPKGTASNEMCTFLILNISSLQLIPVNMIAYRSLLLWDRQLWRRW